MRRFVFASIAGAALLAATVSAAPKSETAATIALTLPTGMVAAASSGIWPAIGDSVSFTVTFPKSVEKFSPSIQVLCYQSGKLVYGEAGPYTQSFRLGGSGSAWLYYSSTTGADCIADLFYWSYQGGQKFNLLASTDFDAAGK